MMLWAWGLLWFKYKMSPTSWCVECLVSSWWHYFGRFWKLWEVWPNWRMLYLAFSPLLTLCFLSATHSHHHGALPHNRLKNKEPSDHGLNPLKPWAKRNFSSLQFFSQVFWSQLWKSKKHRSIDPHGSMKSKWAMEEMWEWLVSKSWIVKLEPKKTLNLFNDALTYSLALSLHSSINVFIL
jgi:hypothetical protein